MSAGEQDKVADATSAPAARPALKDRIADLRLSARAKSVGSSLAERMKAVQASAPAAGDIRDRVKAAASAVRFDREALKAGRDGLAAKVEQLLKPRAVEEAPTAPQVVPPVVTTPSEPAAVVVPAGEAQAQRPDLQALKARLDGALKPKARESESLTPPDRPPSSSSPSAIVNATDASPPTSRVTGIAERIRTGVGAITARRRGEEASAPTPTPAPVLPTLPDITPADARTVRTSRTARARAAEAAERRRPILSLGLLLTAFVAGGVLHILTTFAIPALNSGSAFDRLRWQLEANSMRIFPSDWLADPKKQGLPFLSADMRYAMCRYDLTQGSIQVAAVLPDIGWSLTLYTPQGDNFYAVPGIDGRQVTAAFTLNMAGDRLLLPVPGQRRSDTDAAQVTSPQREGLMIVRAPNRGPAYQTALDDALKAVSCRPVAVRR